MSESKTIQASPSRMLPIDAIVPYWQNPRRIPQDAVDAVARSIEAYGYQQPIVVDVENVVIVGHTRLQALQQLGYTEVEVRIADLPPDKAREYRIIDNKTSEMTSWDHGALVLELREFEDDLRIAYFPDVDLEIEQINAAGATQDEVEWKAKKALAVKEAPPLVTVEVECPSCFHRFSVKANSLPGVSQSDVAALAQ